jgi:lipopolysaccharide export system permease protein
MTIVLGVLAVPLARLRPRQGRYSKMGLALVAYFIYLLLIRSARVWIEQQTLPAAMGIWWLHALALGFALWLLLRQDPLGARTRTTVSASSTAGSIGGAH